MIVRIYCFLIFFALAFSSVSVKSQQWYLSPVFHGRNVYSVFPHTRTNVIVAGGNESNDSLQDIFKSYSGGITWDFGNHGGGGYIRSLDFSDSINGLAVGYAGKILRTTDGGGSWERILPEGVLTQRNYTTVRYVNEETVFAFGGRDYINDTLQTIIKSTDRGETWNTVRDANGRWLKGAHFITENTAFAVGGKGTIIKTTDGGNNWTSVNPPLTDRELNAVYFINETTGFIAGGNFAVFDTVNSVRTLLKTTDGGNTWNVVFNEAGGWLTAINFIDENTGYITGDGAQLYKTTDGGNSWMRQTLPGSQWYSHFTSVKFIDHNFGLVGGLFGEVFLYSTEPLPEVQTMPGTVVQVNDTSATAILRATINTHGNPVIHNFVYSTTPDFSANVNIAFLPIWPISFNSNSTELAEASVSNLLPNTTYYYFAKAAAVSGVVYGDTLSFTTTVPYTFLNTHFAQTNLVYTVFAGTVVNPTEQLNVFFEYGTTTLLGNEVQGTPPSVNGQSFHTINDTVFSLQQNTLYYYRLKAVSQTDTFFANTVSFYNGNLYSDFEATQATNVTGTSATLNALVADFRLPISDITFLYGTNPNQFDNYPNANPSYINDTLTHAIVFNATSLNPNTFYYYKIEGQTALGMVSSNIASFYTGVYSLDFNALPATTIGETFATLNGTVSGFVASQLPVDIIFEYGTGTSFGQTIQSTPFTINDTLTHDLTAFATGLAAGTNYYFRITAQTQSGQVYSNLENFTTAIGGNYFSTLPAINISPSTATLRARITNIDFPVSLSFEYGLTENFGNEITANPATVSDTLYHELSADVTGLVTDTFYYFRTKASYGSVSFYTSSRKVFTGEPEIPNWNFEQWEQDTLLVTPDWNIISDTSFERVTGISGNYALKLTGTNFAMMGYPSDGAQGGVPNFYGGCPFSARPDSVIIYINYLLDPLDSAMFLIHMRSDTNVIAAEFHYITGNSGGTFQRFSFPVNYLLPDDPDSIVFGITSFNPFNENFTSHDGNFMIIDNISFSPAVPHTCNLDFEDWFVYPYDDLKYWYFLKTVFINTDDLEGSHFLVKSEDAADGDYAVELRNVQYLNFMIGAETSNAPNKDLFSGPVHGTPVSRKYYHLNGYYKFRPEASDTMMIDVSMNYNGIAVGNGRFTSYTFDTAFVAFDLPITYYNDTVVPDSVVIYLRTTNYRSALGECSLLIDNLSFDGFWGILPDTSSGIHDQVISEDQINVYPNPAKNNFTVELSESTNKQAFVQIIDIDGRLINQFNFPPDQTRFIFDVSNFNAGLYFIKGSTGDAIFNKKIVVLK